MTERKGSVPAVASRRPMVLDVLKHARMYAVERGMASMSGVLACVVLFCIVVITAATGMLWMGAAMLAITSVIMGAWFLIAGWDAAVNEPVRLAEQEAERRRKAVAASRKAAIDNFETLMPERLAQTWLRKRPVKERTASWGDLYSGLRALLADAQAAEVGDEAALRLRDLERAYRTAIEEAGRSDKDEIHRNAIEATTALVQGAIDRHRAIDERIRRADEERAPDVARRFAETARAVAGLPSVPSALPPPSASAALQRLIGIAEEALATDPDLVDSNGARVDALVRDHLPRLLARHAEAARSPSSNLAKVDGKLAEGVDEVRASIEDALATDARARFNSLVTEVGFLRMRRGE